MNRVCLYGFGAGLQNTSPPTFTHNGIHYTNAPLDEHVQFYNIDLIVLSANPFRWKFNEHYVAYNLSVLSAIKNAMESGTAVCFLMDRVALGFSGNDISRQSVGFKLINEILGFGLQDTTPTNHFAKLDHQFEPFLKIFAQASDVFTYSPQRAAELDLDPLAVTAHPYTVGISVRYSRGTLFFIPANPLEYRQDFFTTLSVCCFAYLKTVSHAVPEYIREFHFKDETPLVAERHEIEGRLRDIDKVIEEFGAKKDIIGLEEEALHKRVPEWLRENLKLSVQDLHGDNKEDFYITDGKENRIAIGEIKSCSQNVKREHITKLRLHRETAGLADDFPSILIVNNFTSAENLKEKDQRVNGLECRKAVQDHVLIIRTLDLVRILDLPAERKEEAKQAMLTATGWLKVSGGAFEIVQS